MGSLERYGRPYQQDVTEEAELLSPLDPRGTLDPWVKTFRPLQLRVRRTG